MKTTMNLPDNLYRKVKTRAAAQGRTVRDVTVELYERWLEEDPPAKEPFDGKAWLERWRRLGERISAAMPPGTDLQDEIRQSRNRLDPKDE
jgi:hypothetical protein